METESGKVRAHRNPSDDALRALLTSARTIAVVGASSNPARPSYGVMQRLLAHGYQVLPINPNEAEVLGQPAYPTLAAARAAVGPIDVVDVFRKAEDTPPVASDAIAVGAKALWLQSGIISGEAMARATSAGLVAVMDLCLGVELSLLAVPRK